MKSMSIFQKNPENIFQKKTHIFSFIIIVSIQGHKNFYTKNGLLKRDLV